MKQFINLLKISLNVNFGISALRYRFTREKKRLWEPILIFLAIIIGGGSLVAFFTMVLYSVYAAGVFMNTPEIVITIGLLASQFVIFVFGIFYIISAFYFSNDVDILVPLPLKPYHILGTKFLIILINEYLVLLPMLIPAIIIYGVGTRPDIAYWFKSVFIMLLSPVIPLIIASVFVLVLMRLINVRKSKDLLMVIGGLLGLFLGVAINYFAQRMSNGNPDEFMQDLLTSRINIIDKLGEKLPHVLWGTYSLSKPGIEGLLYFALTIAVAAIAFIFLLWLGNRIFDKGLLSGQEVSRKKKPFSRANKPQNPKDFKPGNRPVLERMETFLKNAHIYDKRAGRHDHGAISIAYAVLQRQRGYAGTNFDGNRSPIHNTGYSCRFSHCFIYRQH